MNSQNSSKSLLPLVEIIISIGIFTIAVVLTLQVFLLAKFLGDKTSDTARAIFEIQNITENIKLLKTDEDIENYMEKDLGNANSINSINNINDAENIENINNIENVAGIRYYLYYDGEWQRVDSYSDAVFVMKIDMNKDNNYAAGSLYKFNLELYKSEPYPFINDKNVKENKDYKPILASVNTSNFIS